MARILANLDMYRKVPMDLLEGSKQGSIGSWLVLLVIFYLITMETLDYFTTSLVTDLELDRPRSTLMKSSTRTRSDTGSDVADEQDALPSLAVHFDITMMDLKCDYVSIDVVSFLGKQQNVTKHVQKWAVSAEGVEDEYEHRNRNQHDVLELFDPKITQTIEELHDDGEHAVDLDEETLKYALEEHEFVFVDFFASWCSHCVQFAPTWETLAEIMDDIAEKRMHDKDYTENDYETAKNLELPVMIGKVDCVEHSALCLEHRIMSYPTIRLFVNGKPYYDYPGHRTVYSLIVFLKLAEESVKEPDRIAHAELIAQHLMNVSNEEKIWIEKTARRNAPDSNPRSDDNIQRNKALWKPEEHPGCRVVGLLQMDRTPGNFYIQARSPHHDMSPSMTNVSHVIHHLSFGGNSQAVYDQKMEDAIIAAEATSKLLPPEFATSLQPMDGNVYVTQNLHEAHHHYLKLIATNVHDAYQVLQSSQLAYYSSDDNQVPEAKFVVDLSPIRVNYRAQKRQFYDYVTSLMAIVGGTFTVMGMMTSCMRAVETKASSKRSTSTSSGSMTTPMTTSSVTTAAVIRRKPVM